MGTGLAIPLRQRCHLSFTVHPAQHSLGHACAAKIDECPIVRQAELHSSGPLRDDPFQHRNRVARPGPDGLYGGRTILRDLAREESGGSRSYRGAPL